MKFKYPITIFLILFCVLLFSGCTSTSPTVPAQAPGQVQTSVPPTSLVTLSSTPVPAQLQNALALSEFYTFGTGDEKGKATVYKYTVMPTYNWTAPSFNSPREQAANSGPFDIQKG